MSDPEILDVSANNDYPHQFIEPLSRALVPITVESEVTPGSLIAWHDAVEAFLSSALDSDNTRRAYRRHLRDAQRGLGVAHLGEVNGSNLASYRSSILDSDLALSSQRQALAAVRSFLSWVRDLGGPVPTMAVVKTALRTPRGSSSARRSVISERETQALLESAKDSRERALLAVMLGAGLRVAETTSLAVSDIVEDLDGASSLFVRQGKGRKDRHVPIHHDVEELLRAYLSDSGRHLGSDGPLFLAADRGAAGRKRRGLTSRGVSAILASIARRAGIRGKRVSPHVLRHTFAIRCLRSGANVVAIQRLLGHSSLQTTLGYIDHLESAELRLAVPRLPSTEPV
ncbi:MAG: tyrosine-type recombinase/integrase [Dehalococcoidia bacterium]